MTLPPINLILLLFVRASLMLGLLPLGQSGFAALTQRGVLAAGLALFASLRMSAAASVPVIDARSVLVELMVGGVLALACALTVEMAALIGELIDAGRGETMNAFYDPMSADRSSSFALCGRAYVWTIFLAGGGAESLIGAFLNSTSLARPGIQIPLLLDERGLKLLYAVNEFLVQACWSYVPFAVLFLTVEVFIGAISKVMPAASLSAETFQLKSYSAILVLLALSEMGAGELVSTLTRPALQALW